MYFLESLVDGSLYTGQTRDIVERVKRQNSGSVRTTESRAPFRLGYYEVFQTRAEAMWREWELKKWNTDRKKKLIEGFDRSNIVELGL